MTMVQRENPDLFDLYYGDYKGIVSNYSSPIHNLDLIMRGSRKLLGSNKTQEVFHLLMYCYPYFKNNPHHELVFEYVHHHCIVDFYHNHKQLTQQVLDLIYVNIDNGKMQQVLRNNKRNIDLYNNKHLINIV